MSFSTDKTCIIDKMKGYNCDDAERADIILQSYADVPSFLFQNTDRFDCNRPYMENLLDCIDPAQLLLQKVYYNGTSTPLSNPLFLADYQSDNVNFDSGLVIEEVAIMGSQVKKITVSNDTRINVLTVGNGATVDVIETLDTSSIGYLRIRACVSYISTVGMLTEGSVVDNIWQQDGSIFGGYNCLEITTVCGNDVTGLVASDQTSNSITLNWVPPSNTIQNKLYYKFKDSNDWILVIGDEPLEFGNFSNDNKRYVFRDLRFDTYYDFKVVNICEDGIPSAGATVTSKTLGSYNPGP